jgi:replicative DNA helicase
MTETLQNPGFERALLALILRDNAVLNCIPRLRPDDFSDSAHGETFATMLSLQEAGRPISPVTLSALDAADPLGGSSLLDALRAISFADETPDAESLADTLADLAERRRLAEHGAWLAEQATSPRISVRDLINTFSGELDAINNRLAGENDAFFDYASAMEQTLAELDDPQPDARIPSGLSDLDRRTGGFGRGHLTIIAARPSMGKSTLAICLATNAALAGHGVLAFSMEMSRGDWMVRAASEATFQNGHGILYTDAIRGELLPEARKTFRQAGLSRTQLPIELDCNPGRTVTEMASRIRRVSEDFARKGRRLGLVLVDHLGKVKPTQDYRGRRDLELGQITTALTEIAKTADVSVIALHQLNREVESAPDDGEEMTAKRPKLSHLRDSGRIEEDADNVILMFRPEYYLERQKFDTPEREQSREILLDKKRNILELNIAKFRQGQTGTVELFCDIGCNAIRDLERSRA